MPKRHIIFVLTRPFLIHRKRGDGAAGRRGQFACRRGEFGFEHTPPGRCACTKGNRHSRWRGWGRRTTPGRAARIAHEDDGRPSGRACVMITVGSRSGQKRRFEPTAAPGLQRRAGRSARRRAAPRGRCGFAVWPAGNVAGHGGAGGGSPRAG